MTSDKLSCSTLPDEDLRPLVATALETLLQRRPFARDRLSALRDVRLELDYVLTHAVASSGAADAIAFHARLAAICNAEFARVEALLTADAQHLPGVRR